MNKLHFVSLGAVAVVFSAVASACVGSDPAVAPSPTTDDAGTLADTGTSGPGADSSTLVDSSSPSDAAASCAPKTACGDTCVDLKSSADNCGACGHSCGGGECKSSLCLPVLVASNITQPLAVAVAATSAFWMRNGAVERCPITGCTGAPTSITAEVVIGGSQPQGTTLVTDGNQVAWIATGNNSGNGRDIFSCGVAGCNGFSPKTSTGLTGAPTQLALESSTLYSTQDLGAERQGPIGTLAMAGAGIGSDQPTGIAADKTYIYVAGVAQSAAGVDRCTRAGTACTGTITRMFQGATYIAAGGGLVIATSSDGIKTCPSAAGCGGNATVLVGTDKAAGAIAANDAFVVWVNPGMAATATGQVRVCALPNCAGGPRTIADLQDQPVSVTIANGFVYWANKGVGAGSGSIWRAAL